MRCAFELTALASATAAPFNVNFFCHTPPRVDAQRAERAGAAALAPFLCESWASSPDPAPADDCPHLRSAPRAADVLAEFKPRVVSFHFGTSFRGARVTRQGLGREGAVFGDNRGGGAVARSRMEWMRSSRRAWRPAAHRGMFLSDDVSTQIGTLALRAADCPRRARAGRRLREASPTPVACRPRSSSAQRVCRSARPVLPLPRNDDDRSPIRAALKSESARHTALTNVFTGRPARAIVNRLVREIGPIESGGAGVSARLVRRHAAARQGRGPGENRLLVVLVGSERQRVQGSARCRADRRSWRQGIA